MAQITITFVYQIYTHTVNKSSVHGTIHGRAGCCTEGTLIMQSNSITDMSIYLLKPSCMTSSPAVRCESIWEKRHNCEGTGFKERASRSSWRHGALGMTYQPFESSGTNRQQQNSTWGKPQVSVNRNHKSSIRKSTQGRRHGRLVSTSKGTAKMVTGSTDHIKVCAVLFTLRRSAYPNQLQCHPWLYESQKTAHR